VVELRRLAVQTRQGIVLLDPRQVSHAVLGDGELVTIATSQGDYLTDSTLQELASRLPSSFMRVHRRALLNLEHVVRFEPTEDRWVPRADGAWRRGPGVSAGREGAAADAGAAPPSEDDGSE